MDISDEQKVLKWFGLNLRRIRKEKGLSQEALAEKAKVDHSFYGYVERGEKSITIKKLSQITKALDIQIKDLFTGEPSPSSSETDKEFDKLVNFLREQDPEDISFLNELLPTLINWKTKNG